MIKNQQIVHIEKWCKQHKTTITIADVHQAVVDAFCLGLSIAVRDKVSKYAEARKAYCWYCNLVTNIKLPEVRKTIGRTRAAVYGSLKAANNLLSVGDEKFTTHIIEVHKQLEKLEI